MADALFRVLLVNLNKLIGDELGLIWGVDKEMRKLASLLSTIQKVLEDAEENQITNKPLQDWLRKLKDAAYKVDDILDECATEAASRFGQNSSLINKVRNSRLNPHILLFRHKIGSRMRDISKMLEDIAKERSNFHLKEGRFERLSDVTGNRQIGPIITQPRVYGRDEDIEKIVECLVEKVACSDDLSVYPIFGLGGLGKTTLAQKVFNDDKIKSHFELRIWVCISVDFSLQRIINAIFEYATGSACKGSELAAMQKELQETLNGKRYLLVLDDVWNEDPKNWDDLKCVLACGSRGASIIVTTRIESVAKFMGTNGLPLHRLSTLNEDDCWSLFKERAFRLGIEERPNLVAWGKKIVNKCGGVPLAVKSLGSMMSLKSEENLWISVAKSELWNLPQDKYPILPALRLSYYNLPSYIRQCFAYCAIFPKDFIIEKDLLIQLWMANGFIPSTRNLDLEDTGNEICKELCWRSFLEEEEDIGEDDFSYVKRFKMHDLVHDLAQFIMEDECVVDDFGSSTDISKRTIHYASSILHTFPEAIYQAEALRTFVVHSGSYDSYGPYGFLFVACWCSSDFSRLRYLRVLDAKLIRERRLSSSISRLKHLRYLDLSRASIEVLPESVCTLYNLQTLNLRRCKQLQKLPKHTKRLKNLRHLYLDGCEKLSEMPPEIRQIICLKTLTRFIVGKKRGCYLDELKGLNLGGSLSIEHLQRVENPRYAKEANLVEKPNLGRLSLAWDNESDLQSQEDVEKVLEALQPHTNLKRLEISGYKGGQFPSWMRDSILNNVVCIEISNCDKCSQLPPLALLPSLRTLCLSDMSRVMYIDDHFQGGGMATGFPSLRSLEIKNLPSLQRFSREDGRKMLPRLTSLCIVECPKLTLQHLPSVEQLRVFRCNEVVLGSISNLKNLISLEVSDNNELNYLPEGMLLNLTSLKTLEIRCFWELKCLPTEIGSLSSLEKLDITWCYEFESFPEQGMEGLKRLKYLTLFCCPELVALPDGMKYLTSLSHLELNGSERDSKLEVLPDVLRYVPSLQSLEISNYSNLESLPHWLGDLTSLQTLTIFNCPKLPSLPASIQGLTMLQNLCISSCPELEKRTEKEKGEDWYKIAHIPNVEIDDSDELM